MMLFALLVLASTLPYTKGSHLAEESEYWRRILEDGSPMSIAPPTPSPPPMMDCKLDIPEETTEACQKANTKQELPLCVGIRGNGQRVFAHFPALARTVEAFGPVFGLAGGSSGAITSFLLESMQRNPLTLQCGENCCTGIEQRARISFFLKSIEAIPSEEIIPLTKFLTLIFLQVQQQNIIGRLLSNDPVQQEAAVQDLLDILTQDEIQSFVNPDLIALLENSPNPVFHAVDVLMASTRDFTVGDDVLVFIRPYIINFPAVVELVDVLASFYSGLEPVDLNEMETMLLDCAQSTFGQDWNAIASMSTVSGETCGEVFTTLYQEFNRTRNSSHPTRLDDALGDTTKTLIATGVLTNNAVRTWETATDDYFNASVPVDWNIDFEDVSFGYYGDQDSLNRVSEQLPNLFQDIKSDKFLPPGPATWRTALEQSLAEPTLSRGVPINNEMVSVAGWPDLVPAQVLAAMGCDRIVLLNRPGGVGDFARDVVRLLGASPQVLEDLYSLEDPESAFVTALQEADATYCVDWDTPPSSDQEALAQEGYIAPLLSDDPCILSLDVGATNEDILGCTA